MTEAWKTIVADAMAKPPVKRTPLEIESIRLAIQRAAIAGSLARI
jgi:hypothetical protein